MYKKIMIGIFGLILVALPILTFILMPKEAEPFSENENRYLARFPTLTYDKIKEKEAMNGFDKWFSDRFAFREGWINLKNNSEKTIGKKEISGVFTEQGRMMEVWKGYKKEEIDKSLNAINDFALRHNKPTYFSLAPTSQEIYKNTLPKSAAIGDQRGLIDYCKNGLKNVTSIDIYDTLSENKDEYIYYRTDHHWTSYGAYLAYLELGKQMGFSPIDISKFNIEHASSDFRGTLFSKTLDTSIAPDIIDYYTLSENEPKVKVRIMKESDFEDFNSMYFREYLEVKDKYSSFLGQNAPIVEITNEEATSNKTLVVFKDSYAHALVPFLTKHYKKITVMDMRYINVSYANFVGIDEFDEVLFTFNAITFSDDTNIRKLNMGK